MGPLKTLGIALAGAWLATTPALAQQKAVNLRFGTVGIGSAWYNYGAGIADIVKPKLPAGSAIEVLPKAGGIGNLKLVQRGEMELGLTFSVSAAEACGGYNTFKTKQDKVRGLMGGLDTYYFGTFVTKKSGVNSWNDIIAAKNKFHLLTTKPGGTGELAVREVIEVLGSSEDQIKKKGGMIEPTQRTNAAETIRDGQADGWAHVVTRGHPAATQIVTINDMKMLPLPDSTNSRHDQKVRLEPRDDACQHFQGANRAGENCKDGNQYCRRRVSA